MTTLEPIEEEMINEFDDASSVRRIGRQDSQDACSVDFSDVFTVATYDTMGSLDDLESMDGTIDDSVSNFSSSPSSGENSPPPRYEESFDFVTKLWKCCMLQQWVIFIRTRAGFNDLSGQNIMIKAQDRSFGHGSRSFLRPKQYITETISLGSCKIRPVLLPITEKILNLNSEEFRAMSSC